jgi:hypothetical protein
LSEHITQLRAIVAGTPSPAGEMAAYLAKVRDEAYTVTDHDVESLLAAGFSQDQIFEQTVAAAIGEGLRRLDAATAVIG